MREAHQVLFIIGHELVFLPVKVGSGVGAAINVAIDVEPATDDD